VLVRTIASRQIIVAACDQARACGIAPAMTLAEARALCATVHHAQHQPAADLQALHRFARWMMRFSPLVSVEPPDAIALDVTGSERLFGSFERLIQLTTIAISRLGFHHGIAIAPTLGAAWALASFASSDRCIVPRSLKEILAPLPVAALRLEEELIETLATLGIETIGQLSCLPRHTLPARFGASILLRLDQAMGLIDEPLAGIEHHEPIQASLEFEAAIDSLEMIEEGLRLLLARIIPQLQQHGCGARQLIVEYIPFRAPPIQKTIHLSRPTASRSALLNLLRCATESAKAEDGFIGLRLSVPVY
jgi:protein ImuB